MDVALAAVSGLDIELEIRISGSGISNMLQCGGRERRASQVGVQDHAGGVDDRTQRVSQRLPNLALDCIRDSREGEVDSVGFQFAAAISARTRPVRHGPRP